MTEATHKSGRKRVVIAAGSLLGIGAIAVAAAFTDFANLNLGGVNGAGFGSADNTFNVKVVGTDENGVVVPGTWQEADTAEGVEIALVGAEELVPGASVGVSIPVLNDSPKHEADLALTLGKIPGKTGDATYEDQLRYTITVDGTAVVTNAKQSEVNDTALGSIKAGEEGTVAVSVTLLDQGSEAANNALQGKTAYVQAQFHATSAV